MNETEIREIVERLTAEQKSELWDLLMTIFAEMTPEETGQFYENYLLRCKQA